MIFIIWCHDYRKEKGGKTAPEAEMVTGSKNDKTEKKY